MVQIFPKLRKSSFNLGFTYHADAILRQDFPLAIADLDSIVSSISIPVVELIEGGGGEARSTQRLRRALYDQEWHKINFQFEKKINDRTTFSQSHEVDHVKEFPRGAVALEIEWNNKDPFFDRDLENFNRLHSDGAISVGVIVTRGDTFQNGIEEKFRNFAVAKNIRSFADLEEFGVEPTRRQRDAVENYRRRSSCSFPKAWAACFTRDKYGSATTHWLKLKHRLDRGVGSPCPIVGIGIPLSRISE